MFMADMMIAGLPSWRCKDREFPKDCPEVSSVVFRCPFGCFLDVMATFGRGLVLTSRVLIEFDGDGVGLSVDFIWVWG